MTIDRMTPKALVEKGSVMLEACLRHDDLLREMMAYVANRMMDVEVESLTGARRALALLHQPPEWLSHLGDAGRHGRAGDPEAQKGPRLPGLPGATPGIREGAHRRHPGSLRPRRLSASIDLSIAGTSGVNTGLCNLDIIRCNGAYTATFRSDQCGAGLPVDNLTLRGVIGRRPSSSTWWPARRF